MIIDTNFWINFWPNFVSTVAGLILGLPLAIWTNYLLTRGQVESQKRADVQRLLKSLTVLRETIIENRVKIAGTIRTLNENKVQLDTRLDSSVWGVVKSEIIQVLHDPVLQKKLAYHFSSLASFVDLNRLYLNLNVGVNGIVTGTEPTMRMLKESLLEGANNLIIEMNELQSLIETKLK